MRKYFKSLFVILSLLLFTVVFAACSMSSSDDVAPPTATATVTIAPKVDPDSGGKTVTATRNASTFKNAKTFNPGLAFASFCLSISADTEQKLKDFFKDFEFDNFEAHNAKSANYDDNKIADSISYGLAHCKDEDFDVIAIAIRGGAYGMEWISNFELGSTGDHAGFSSAAKMVYEGLKKYIDNNYSKAYADKTLKILITGYSRAAAVSNVLAYYILTGLEGDSTYVKLDIDANDVFVYTFATPRALCSEHALPYENVFNLYSKTDMVTYMAPEQYGFKHCGTDKILFECNVAQYTQHKEIEYESSSYKKYKVSYTSVIDTYLKEFNSDIDLPSFCKHTEYSNRAEPDFPGDAYKTEKDCIEYFLKQIFNTTKTGGFNVTNREKFVATAQPTVQYFLKLYMENKEKLPKVIENLKSDYTVILTAIASADNFYTFVKDKLTEVGINPDADTTYGNLKDHCTKIYEAVDIFGQKGVLSDVIVKVLPMLIAGNQDFQRIIKMHYPEVTCVTLIKTVL